MNTRRWSRIETVLICLVLASTTLAVNASQHGNTEGRATWIDVERSRSVSGAEIAEAAAAPVIHVEEDSERIDVTFSLDGYLRESVEVEGGTYTRLTLPGTGLSGDHGHPALPFKGVFVEIPYGVEVAPRLLDFEAVPGRVTSRVLPMQPSVPESEGIPPFTVDAEAYEVGGLQPQKVVEVAQVGFIRGTRVAFLRIYPIQYDPTSGELKIYRRMSVSLSFEGEVDPSGVDRKRRLSSREFNSLSRRLIENYREVRGASPVGEESTGGATTGAAHGAEASSTMGADYLIIVADGLLDDCTLLNEFVEWKTMKGYKVAVATMSDVGRGSTRVARFIWDAYHDWHPAPTYVLLLGNADDVPSRMYQAMAFFSDHEYVLTDGSDHWADMLIGRIIADDGANHCDAALQKILDYDRDPDTAGDWYNTTALFSYFQDGDGDCTANRWFADITAHVHDFMDSIDRDVTTVLTTTTQCGNAYLPCPATYPHMPEFDSPLRYTDADFTSNGRLAVADAFNDGAGLVVHRNHGTGFPGSATGNGETYWGHPYFNNGDVRNRLTNNIATPFVFSFDCGTGTFTGWDAGASSYYRINSIAETLIQERNAGGVGVIAPTVSTSTGQNELLMQGAFTSIWPDYDPGHPTSIAENSLSLGGILHYMKSYQDWYVTNAEAVEYHAHAYHAFGDPELTFRRGTPATGYGFRAQETVCDGSNWMTVYNVPPDSRVTVTRRMSDGTLQPLGFEQVSEWTAQLTFGVSRIYAPGPVYVTVSGPDLDPATEEVAVVGCDDGCVSWGTDRINQYHLPLDDVCDTYGEGAGANVYVMSTGIYYSHQIFGGLGGRADYFWDKDGSNAGWDCNGIGTFDAGIIQQVAGQANLWSVRVTGCTGAGMNSDFVEAADYICSNGSRPGVVHVPLGGSANTSLDAAIRDLALCGYTVVVAASGSPGGDACSGSPGRAPEAFTVGATTSADRRADFSSVGACVDIFAPGESITSAWNSSPTASKTTSGTNAAAAYAAGVVAVHLGANRCNNSITSCETLLLDEATPDVITDVGTGSPNLLLHIDRW